MTTAEHLSPYRWPRLAEHLRAPFVAEQAEARERLLCSRGISERQAPENRSPVSTQSDFHRYWQQRRTA